MISLNHFSLSVATKCISTLINSSKNNFLRVSIHVRNFMKMTENVGFCSQDCISLLQQSGDLREASNGKSVHSVCVKTGLDRDVFVQNNTIRFYAICGDLMSARQLFDEMPEPNLVSWTSMISSYVHDGQYEIGLRMFSLMCRSGLGPNEFGFSVALKACRIMHAFVMGKLLHGLILKYGFESYSFCSASILAMYVESGDISNAHNFFDEIPLRGRSEASWNTLLDSYAETSNAEEAFKLFHQMMYFKMIPNCFTYTILIKLCANMLNIDLLRLFHGRLIKLGFEDYLIVGGALVDPYAKLGFLNDAGKVFQNLEEKDNVVWCALLAGFHQNGEVEQGLNFYLKFLSEGNKPDPFMFASVFSLCSNSKTEGVGTQVHCSFIKYGFMLDSFLGSALIDMYGGVGMIFDAYKCFVEVIYKNEICFSTMINNLVFNSNDEIALEIFCEMRKLGLEPSHSTLSYILRACANLHMLKEGRSLHCYVAKNFGISEFNLCIENALLEMYAKCGVVDEAKNVFKEMQIRNEFSWTTMISGYSETGQFEEALGLFQDMILSSVTAKASEFTLVVVLQACMRTETLDRGKQVHNYVIKAGFEFNLFVGSALINMYAAFKHEVQNAYLVFSSIKAQDLVIWSSMITAWAQNGKSKEALKLFIEFHNAPNFLVDEPILSSCLSACAGLALLDMGKCFHARIIRTGFQSYLHVASSIIDMYSKCGSIIDARKFFDEMRDHNIVSWTTMMSGYAHHGLGREAVNLFNEMKDAWLKPDSVTFVGLLTACSHAGLVKEGWQCFESMINDHGLEVSINHYACMVDLLGRAGQVDEAEALINKAPFRSKNLLWKTLLGACNKHGQIEAGNRIAQMLVELEPNEPSTYVLVSNIYASASMWDSSIVVRNKMKEENVNRQPGCSWIQVAS
ncbi:hypothetical protein F0562_008104 [Nyssa sinensis]|uniref:Pentacotripeptide-repeat region of PRORP domain-containing protein n=1 Tax=Nyssa sinensis TaxID=561372 RepID=A0A5J5A733_9ASTE|nr:hypothetical protein F0562_008104 [Nyssa sinensis]